MPTCCSSSRNMKTIHLFCSRRASIQRLRPWMFLLSGKTRKKLQTAKYLVYWNQKQNKNTGAPETAGQQQVRLLASGFCTAYLAEEFRNFLSLFLPETGTHGCRFCAVQSRIVSKKVQNKQAQNNPKTIFFCILQM